MKRIGYLLIAAFAMTGGAVYLILAPARAEQAAVPVFDVKLPSGYRDWKLVSVAHEEGSLNELACGLRQRHRGQGLS